MVNSNNKPRIRFIGTLPPPVHGSAMVSQQIKDSKVILDAFRCDWVNLSTSRRMDEIGKKTFAKPFRLIGALVRELWLLTTRHYDLCYLAITCHGVGFLKDSAFVLMAKLFRKKIVIHQHNKGMANDVDRWPYRWLLPLCYRNAKVILLSWYLYPDIEKVVPKENVVICPNGIKVDKNESLEDKSYRKTENKVPHLLFLSNLIESKGVFVLLDALKILADKGFSFVCDFVGGETKEIDARRLAEEVDKRQLNRVVFYHGRKTGEEKEKFFEESDIFVLPTFNETFGLVNLEAMAHHLPVVTTDEGGIPDVVQDGVNGKVSERKNACSLADCIEDLLADPSTRKEMGEAGFKMLKEKFTDEIFQNRMRKILVDENTCAVCRGGVIINELRYHGKQYGETKTKAFEQSDVFVLPTMNDCFPLVLLEAMEHGKPIVTTAIGGIPDIVIDGETGYICPKQDTEQIAMAIERLISDAGLRKSMGEAGRKRLEEQFTAESFEKRMTEILVETMGRD